MDALRFVDGRYRAVLGFTVLAVLLALPAVAVEGPFDPDPNSTIVHSQSIESETTFDLFENEYDQMLMPSYMGFFEDAGRFYTQLGNIDGQNAFQFGHYRPMGPGYFNFRVLTTSQEFEETSSSQLDDFDDDPGNSFFSPPNVFLDVEQDEFEFWENDLYVGYAWPLTENGSLGFGLNFYSAGTEQESSDLSSIDRRSGLGAGASDDQTITDVLEFNEEQDWITLIAEWMHRGDMSWRVRLNVSDVDHKIENNLVHNDLLLVDNDDSSEEGFPTISDEESDVFRYDAVGGEDFIEGSSSSFLNRVGHDGQSIGLEGDIRWEKNPKLHHQLNAGITSGSFDVQDDLLLERVSTTTTVFDAGGGSTITDVFVDTDNHTITDDDISSDSQFVTWKTRWHLGDTHVGVGLYVFNFETELEVTADADDVSSFTESDDTGVIFFNQNSTDDFFVATHDEQITTISIPFALEQDINDNLQVRLGAQYIMFDFNDEFSEVFTQGDFTNVFDPDGDGAGAPTTTTTENQQVFTDTFEDEEQFDEVVYNAGLMWQFERVDLEFLFTGTDGGGSSREGVDLDQVYVGATFKLGDRKK